MCPGTMVDVLGNTYGTYNHDHDYYSSSSHDTTYSDGGSGGGFDGGSFGGGMGFD